MADKNVNIKYSIDDKASGKLSGIKASTVALGTALGTLAVKGLTKIIGGFNNLIKVAGIQELAVANLNNALKRNGTFTQEASIQAQKFASALQKQTTFGDEAILNTQAILAELGNLSGDGLERATEATLDLSTRLGMDLNSAASLVGKTIGSSTNALGRYGVEVEGAVGSNLRLENTLNGIASKFGGAAKNEAETFQGKLKQLQNETGDLQEKFGFLIIKGLTPLVKATFKATSFINENFSDMVDQVKFLFIDLQTFFEITKEALIGILAAPFSWETYKDIVKIAVDKFYQFGQTMIGIFDAIKSFSLKKAKELFTKFNENMEEEKAANLTLAEKIIKIKADAEKKKQKIIDKSNEKIAKSNEIASEKNIKIAQVEKEASILAKKEENKGLTELAKKKAKEEKELQDKQKEENKKLLEKQMSDQKNLENFIIASSKKIYSDQEGLIKGYGNFLKDRLISEINAFFSAEQAKLAAVALTNWWNPIGWESGAKIAGMEGLKQFAIAGVKSVAFADGGIVPGNSFSGDKVLSRLNSDEMVLNKKQQRNLFNVANLGADSFSSGSETTSQAKEVIILDSDGTTMLAKGTYQKQTDLLRTGELQSRR